MNTKQETQASLLFKSIDVKNKGYVTIDDLKDISFMTPDIFKWLDADQNGKLTLTEFENKINKSLDLYKLYDTENVGFITKNNLKNFPGPMHISDQLFDSLDENNDGIITLDEFLAGFTRMSSVDNNIQSETNSNIIINNNDDEEEEDKYEFDYNGDSYDDEEFERVIHSIDAKFIVDKYIKFIFFIFDNYVFNFAY